MQYETAVPVASGGTATVLKAWDPRLERWVALKYLKHDDPVQVERLLREAKAQSRLHHPNICEIYEVAEDERGRPYICMQFIDGPPLDEAMRDMDVRTKARVVQQVAEAVHSAHQTGIVHRDLKPGNILVETREDGSLEPFVVDFGLARVHEAPGLTVTGEVMGTPAFMPPEQAGGQAVDARSDVYSLGAVLYHALGGRPPFGGDANLSVLVRVLEQEPEQLRRLEPTVPVELETITHTCLEKDARHRYESAQALADDLGRWLDERPLEARRIGRLTRTVRRARRRPHLTAAISAALTLILVFAGIAIYTRWSAAEEARLAQDFAREAEAAAAELRFAHTAPIHDIRPDRERMRRQMAEITAAMERRGRRAEGPGHSALGRAFLALGETEAALDHLDRAWSAGMQTPAVSEATGRALAELYLQQLNKVMAVNNDEVRALRRREIEDELRAPALAALRRAREAGATSPAYLEGLTAWLEDRPDEALEHAAAAVAETTWLYEAQVLMGDVHTEAGFDFRDEGDRDRALESYGHAIAAYDAAAATATSDPVVLERLVRLALAVFHLDTVFDVAPDESWQEFNHRLATARTVDPERVSLLVASANAGQSMALLALETGKDPRSGIEEARATAQMALELDPSSAEACSTLGDLARVEATYLMENGGDPSETFAASAQWFERALEIDPDSPDALTSLGIQLYRFSMYQAERGEDRRPSLRRAVILLERLTEVEPGLRSFNNLSAIATQLATAAEAGSEEQLEAMETSVDAARGGIEVAPDNPRLRVNLANGLLGYGNHLAKSDLDPLPAWNEAIDNLHRAEELAPDLYIAHYAEGLITVRMARHAASNQELPDTLLEQARDAYQRAIDANPGLAISYYGLGNATLILAEARIARGESANDLVAESIATQEQALKIDPDSPWALGGLAEALVVEAELVAVRGGDPSPTLRRIDELLEQLRGIHPESGTIENVEERVAVLREGS